MISFRRFVGVLLPALGAVLGANPPQAAAQSAGAPHLLAVTNAGNNTAAVAFSLPVRAAGATNTANYTLTNAAGPVAIVGATLGADGQTVLLTTASQTPFAPHWLLVSGVADAATGTNLIAPRSGLAFTNAFFTTGYIERQLYFNIAGGAVADLTGSPKFPNQPDQVDFPPAMGWPTPNIGTNYGGRMAGLLLAPLTGTYYFSVTSDDNSTLYLSTDESPVDKVPVASEPAWGNSFDHNSSAAITLTAGRHYFIEALMKQGGGGDSLEVAWKTPANPLWSVIPAANLGGYNTATNPALTLLQGPASLTAIEGRTATFTAAATGACWFSTNVAYQWQANGFDLPAAAGATYTTPPLGLTNSGTTYRAVVAIPGRALFTTNAILTVAADTNPPAALQAYNSGTGTVVVIFSKPVEAAGATNPANYSVSGGVAITGAALAANLTNVFLFTTPLTYGGAYVVGISGIRDRAAKPNTIAPNSMVSFLAAPFAPVDIGGGGSGGGTPTVFANTATVAALTTSGGDIGGVSDQFGFDYLVVVGDFDKTARLTGLQAAQVWAKAGWMARETLDPASRFAAALATPAMNGDGFYYRDPAGFAANRTGGFPVNYPNTWLRLQRVGNTFTGYAGYDGTNWSVLGTVTIGMAAQIYVGLAASAFGANQTATAVFQNFGTTSPQAVTGAAPLNPHEALGPSSRKSPIAISEIMYQPVPRPDGRNLEFLELYNSNPWVQDISNYRVTAAGGLTYTFPAGTRLAGGAFAVVAAAPGDLTAVYGVTNVYGPYTSALRAGGNLQLWDELGSLLLTVPYDTAPPWPAAANGAGHSLVLGAPSYGEGDPRAWDISDVVGGSPGAGEPFHPSPLRAVVVNEFLVRPTTGQTPYVELYNHSAQAVDVSGCGLTDDPATNKWILPAGTTLAAGGFRSFPLTLPGFAPNPAGGTIYLINPDGSRVVDAVNYPPQGAGIAFGRSPDGATEWYRLQSPTPGGGNAAPLINDIALNELMYSPLSGVDDDQYVELYNQGTNSVNLGGWQLAAAIHFTFPTNTWLLPGAYLVVGRNTARLLLHYPNLNPTNLVGNFTGKLSGEGERLVLSAPDTILTAGAGGTMVTNAVQIPVDEVTYGPGGRWGAWTSGGGSSLELRDPRANHRLAPNWAGSDETQKSAWTDIEVTAPLDNGANFDPSIDYVQIGLLDAGECLVDNIEVRAGATGTNLVANPDFEHGLTNWYPQGCLFRSSLENSGYGGGHSLHVRCSDRMWTGVNSCEGALVPNTLAAGQLATLRFKARWVAGWPEVLLRLNGNWLEATGALPVPANLGTPGARNSRAVTNAGPAITAVTHNPPVPAAGQPVVVSARITDRYPLTGVVLSYRLDPSLTNTLVPMRDDGTGGDAVAGDGIYSATIPGQPAGTLAAFVIRAADALSSGSVFPALANDNAPAQECSVFFGDAEPAGSFGVYHLWVTATNAARWSALADLSNEAHDATMVNGKRIIYNAKGRFAGSPYHQNFDTPYGNLCHYKWIFPDDDKFLGATSFNKIHQPGNGPGDDATQIREQTAYTFLRALGVPHLNRRLVAVYVNGVRRGQLMEDTQTPDSDMVKQWFPNDTGGFLYKMQPWFEFAPFPSGNAVSFSAFGGCELLPYYVTGTQTYKPARYRYTFEIRRTPDSANNFTHVFSLVAAANNYGNANFTTNLLSLANMENWMRVLAGNHAAGNADCWGVASVQNLYGYLGAQGTPYTLMMWDMNYVFDHGPWAPGQNLIVNYGDPTIAAIYANPTFQRMYWRALGELVNGPLQLSVTAPLATAKYQTFLANGLTTEDPALFLEPYIGQAHDSIAAQLAAVDTTNFTAQAAFNLPFDLATFSGTAPLGVKTIAFNGIQWPVTWTTLTNWTASVPLQPGTNAFVVQGVNRAGQPVAGASNQVTLVFNGVIPSPAGTVVINELMYQPAITNAEYVEIYNNSFIYSYDLSGWQLAGLGYTFPPGTVLGPNRNFVLTANRAAFATAYGATVPVYDTFTNQLSTTGQYLALVRPPAPGTTNRLVVAQVAYGSTAPWPAATNGTGLALQLRDPHQDNWRAGNWSAAAPTPGGINAGYTSLPPFPPLWINEVEPVNLTGLTNAAGVRAPWIELFNPSGSTQSLAGLYLTANYTNLTNWAFPPGASLAPNQFLVIFADGQTNLATSTELHTGFTLAPVAGSVALARVVNGQAQVMDYLDYTNLTANRSLGATPDGQSFARQSFYYVTPGQSNNATSAPLPLFINEWMAANSTTLRDPADANQADDWFELYNAGTNWVDPAGYYLTDDPAVPLKFLIPTGYAIAPHGFLLVWADKKSPTGTPPLHVNFKLARAGKSIGLYGPDGRAVDLVNFGPQGTDISQGRCPDGGAAILFMDQASPGTNNLPPNTPPTLAALPDWKVTLGQSIAIMAMGTDSDQPAQTLTYSLGAGAPAGAAINPANGQFTWQPTTAPATNQVVILVTDNGTPKLSAGQSFSVTTYAPPQLLPPHWAGGQLILGWNTAPGQGYQVEYQTDLNSSLWVPWGPVVTGTGSPASLTNAVPGGAPVFFRVRLTP